jgi:hypothetical protein
MKAPEKAEVFETATSRYWFEGEVLYAVSKKAPPLESQEQEKQTKEFLERLKGKRVCAVLDISNSAPTTKEGRDKNKTLLPKMFKAIAFISHTALGKMVINLYLGLQPMPFPTKVFNNENEAKVWILQYTD